MEQLVMEQRVGPVAPRPMKLWHVVPTTATLGLPSHTPSIIIINYCIRAATLQDTDVVFIPDGIILKKDRLPKATLLDVQACLQRQTNDIFPVRVHITSNPTEASHVLEAPCMFIERQTPDWFVLRHAWWQGR